MGIPKEGEFVTIQSYKHDGHLHRTWRDTNIIAMIREKGVSYYCNLASPYVLDDEALKYIDYDLDIKVFPDGEKRLLDVDEYEFHSKLMDYPEDIDFILKENVKTLVDWINNEKGPFSPEYVDIWYQRYQQLSKK